MNLIPWSFSPPGFYPGSHQNATQSKPRLVSEVSLVWSGVAGSNASQSPVSAGKNRSETNGRSSGGSVNWFQSTPQNSQGNAEEKNGSWKGWGSSMGTWLRGTNGTTFRPNLSSSQGNLDENFVQAGSIRSATAMLEGYIQVSSPRSDRPSRWP